MAIQLRVSTSLDILSSELIADLTAEKPKVFDKQWVVIPTEGINNWLRQQLAIKMGIATNLQFTNMNDILQLLYYWVCPDEARLMNKDRMTWALFTELNDAVFIAKFPSISAYYEGNESRRAALASEMADLFDQYQVYRHDKIAEWKKDEANEEDTVKWQIYLWQKMKTRLGDSYSDRLDISNRLLERLGDTSIAQLVKDRLPCIRFFGLAIVTPYYLELFRVLSGIIDVKFYLLNPCPDDLWMDDLSDRKIASLRNRPDLLEHRKAGNELLVNWGKVLRDSYKLLLAHDDYVNSYEVISDVSNGRGKDTLLMHIQQEILGNVSNESRLLLDQLCLYDDSLKINGCYTPVREVEVLYNYLLDTFKADSTLSARDVLVMVSDIDKYAPFIRAVFDNAPVELPYTIADYSVAKGNTLFTALREILSINLDTFKSEEVLSLLDSPFIRSRFGFSDISEVRQAVREACIYFGTTDASDDPLYNQTEAWMVSWDYGLEKIIYGLCISGEAEYNGSNYTLYPLDTAEGASMADRVRLYHFIQVLKSILGERNHKRSLSGWSTYLGHIMKEMILDENEEDEDFRRFAYLLETIADMDDVMNGQEIGYNTFRHIFFSRLELERRSNRYAGKGINFCSLVPMRSVPFNVIALLGMDFDKFPRQDSTLSFSLIGKEERPGDRSVRENDKHLFLETLLAAKQKLYISYLARDVQKGTDMPPSTLVDELLDYIAMKAPDPDDFKKAKITIHPLHLFSSKYKDPDWGLPANYLGNIFLNGIPFEKTRESTYNSPDLATIQLDKLAVFFKNPLKFYFNSYLGVYYREDDERIAENELFELDVLQEWQIKDDLLRLGLTPGEYTKRGKMSGLLPLANMGPVIVESLQNEVSVFSEKVENSKNGKDLDYYEVSYNCGRSLIKGSLPVYGDSFIYFAYTSSPLKHIMDPWVRYLVAIAQTNAPRLKFIFVYKQKEDGIVNPVVREVEFSEALQVYAREILPELVVKFTEGHKTPFYFFPPIAPICYKNNPPAFEAEGLLKLYEEDKDNDFSVYFRDDDYLRQLVEPNNEEVGLFRSENMQQLTYNTLLLTAKLREFLPELFEIR